VWKDPPSHALKKLWCIGHAMIRATDAAWTCCTGCTSGDPLDLLGRRYRCWCRRCRPTARLRCRRRARQGQPAPLALGHHHAARRGDGHRHGSFVAALGLAPLVGSEFVPQTDQGFTQLALRMPVGSSLERTDAKVRQVEESIVLACPR
jgi:hypothetical protein